MEQDSDVPLLTNTDEPVVPQIDEPSTDHTELLQTTATEEPQVPATEAEALPVTDNEGKPLQAESEALSVTEEDPNIEELPPAQIDAPQAPLTSELESEVLAAVESGMELPLVETDTPQPGESDTPQLGQDDPANFDDPQDLPSDLEQALSEAIGEAVGNEPSIVHAPETTETTSMAGLEDAPFSMDTSDI